MTILGNNFERDIVDTTFHAFAQIVDMWRLSSSLPTIWKGYLKAYNTSLKVKVKVNLGIA
jgi:hypothetical protein